MPEAVYGPGKSPEQCVRIVGELLAHGVGPVLLTRATDDQVKATAAEHGPGIQHGGCVLWRAAASADPAGARARVTAGTADVPVADECELTLARPRVRRRSRSTTSASPGCTACSPTSTE